MTKKKEFISTFLLVISAIISFVPIVNLVAIAIFCIYIFRFKNYKRELYVFLSIAFVINIIYFSTKPYFDKMWSEELISGFDARYVPIAQSSLQYYFKTIENYNQNHGEYPDSLSDIQNGYMDFVDYSFKLKRKDGFFDYMKLYYEKSDSNRYFLLCIGPDGKPKTKDDIVPILDSTWIGKSGILKFQRKE